LRRLVPGGTDKSYGLHVARLAGVPEGVVAHAEEVMARLESGEWGPAVQDRVPGDRGEQGTRMLREGGEGLPIPPDDEAAQDVLRQLHSLDISNLTPLQALVALNEWQERLRAAQ
jgi:DNA mismatch repair protein MutS